MEIKEFRHFRAFTDGIDLGKLVDFLKRECEVICIVKEFGKSNREHIHSTISLKSPLSTFRDRLKKEFPTLIGNKMISMEKVREYDNNLRYCFKGRPNDYPDILYTVVDNWKDYYTRYWKQYDELHKKAEVNMGCQNDPSVNKKVRSKTFQVRLAEEILDDYEGLCKAIWFHNGYKNVAGDEVYVPQENLQHYQEYLANLLLQKMGKSYKILDDFIFERMYRGLYNTILSFCPQNLTQKSSVELLNKFRHKL